MSANNRRRAEIGAALLIISSATAVGLIGALLALVLRG